MIRNKKILITGGAGFIGTHMATRLAGDNQVTILDINLQNNAFRYSPCANDDSVALVEGDVRDAKLVDELTADADIVLHYASLIGVQNVINHARETIDTILLGTRNVLEAAARKADRIDRLVYISTSEVYGNVMAAPEEQPASVGTINDPRLCYSSAKLMGEHQVWAYHRDYGLPTAIVRPFNIYGPYRTASHAAGLFAVKALLGRDITLFGDGSAVRSWCYIDDFCDGMMGCIESPNAVGEHFNLGNPVTAITIYELARITIELAESSSSIITAEPTFSDIGTRAPSSVKARELLGYKPKVDMVEGLRRTVAWYRDHLDEFRSWG